MSFKLNIMIEKKPCLKCRKKKTNMEKPGSTTRAGYLYHEPAFPVEGFKVHRSDNERRLGVLLRSQNWWNKNVLDLGCNIGYFSIKLALEGARVTGIDADLDAIALAQKQALEYSVENVIFEGRNDEYRYANDKDVLVALSVLPWIYATESNPDACVEKLFKIPVAYIEIQYPPDGRASVPGVIDDDSARVYLKRYYTYVIKLAVTTDNTDGVVRNRTMWKCMKEDHLFAGDTGETAYGSQAEVCLYEHAVSKSRRGEKNYDPEREEKFLIAVNDFDIAPKPIGMMLNQLYMTRIHGLPISSSLCKTTLANLTMQFQRIASALEKTGISHNDIRPSNLILGYDNNVYLIDFGWATFKGEEKPGEPNPEYPKGDVDCLNKILLAYSKWNS